MWHRIILKFPLSLIFLVVYTHLNSQTLQVPGLISPSDQASFQVLGTRLKWNLNSEASAYALRIYSDPNLTNLVFKDDQVTSTSRVAENLQYNTSYYWTIRAYNANKSSLESKAWSFKTMPDNPQAVTKHPRLLITEEDLPRLQSWAHSGNPIYPAFKQVLDLAIQTYDTKFFPAGIPNPNWPDNGSITWSGYVTESYAEFFAFWSLIDPDPRQRSIHAQRARNLLMYVIDQAILGPSAGIPFRDPGFMTYDRSRVYGEGCPLTVDWIYNAKDSQGQDILTKQDKAKIRSVFLRWCEEQLTAYNHPTPIGLINDKQIDISNRWILNNYYSGHARNMTMMSLSIDAADDPEINPQLHFSALGNSLRSYIYNATGAWLYGQYAQYEKPEIVATDYNRSTQGLGFGSGGLSVEGSLYGLSIGWVAQQMLALKTAGWADENSIGKQAKLLESSYWSRLIEGMLHQIAPAPYIPPQATYYGPIYPVANYGDLLRTWVTPELLQLAAPIGLIDMKSNTNPVRLNQCRWFSKNVLQGGSEFLNNRILNTWPGSYATDAIYYYLLFDPSAKTPVDPRPDMNLNFVDLAFNKILSRTDWTTNASWFNWQCHWTTINHQSGDGNQFEFFRKGEWLIKERSGYTNDGIGYTSAFHNTLGLQNTQPANLQWYEAPTIERGGQWTQGVNAGDPVVITSIHPDFVYATGDATNLYNRPNPFSANNASTDIEFASRSIVWLKPDHIVIYDRAKSKVPDRFKRFYIQLTAEPKVSGKSMHVMTPGGQQVFLSNLLPDHAVLKPSVAEDIHVLAQEEFTTHQLTIEDPANPQDVRFLNVIQGADANANIDQALLIQSDTGNLFEGASFKNTLVLFPKKWGETFNATRYRVPNHISKHIITGLKPFGGYNAVFSTIGSLCQIELTLGNQLQADSGGVLILEHQLTGLDNHISKKTELLDIHPNPFQLTTQLQVNLAEAELLSLYILNSNGQKIQTVFENQWTASGLFQTKWDASSLPSGNYIVSLQNGQKIITQAFVCKQ